MSEWHGLFGYSSQLMTSGKTTENKIRFIKKEMWQGFNRIRIYSKNCVFYIEHDLNNEHAKKES